MWKKIIAISAAVLGVDQLTKFLVSKSFVGPPVRVIGDFLRITHLQNPYAIFGLQYKIPLIPLTVLAICAILLILYKSKSLALSLILGGAIGNLIDRMRANAVIDWIDIGVGNLRWPVFNIADLAITIGIFWLIMRGIQKSDVRN